ncbi:MAG: hypothetical protein GX963_08015 [Bacteroidales bacterium]|nr:hypothetical protein [Bacteroidales bacterium]
MLNLGEELRLTPAEFNRLFFTEVTHSGTAEPRQLENDHVIVTEKHNPEINGHVWQLTIHEVETKEG